MSENLEIIFNSVLDKAYKLRKANPTKFDGLGFWQPIKKILEPLDKYSAKKWKKIPKKLTKKIMLLPEYTIYAKASCFCINTPFRQRQHMLHLPEYTINGY